MTAKLTEGKTYLVKATTTNMSTKAGVPVAALLTINIAAVVNSQIMEDSKVYGFAAEETHTFEFSMAVPMGTGGKAGAVVAEVLDPDGNKLADGSLDVVILEAVIKGWNNPIGYNDPNNAWQNEGFAMEGFDYYTIAPTKPYNCAISEFSVFGYSSYLEFIFLPAESNKMRFSALSCPHTGVSCDTEFEGEIDIYYDGSWHNIFSFRLTNTDRWREVPFASQTVSKVRIRWKGFVVRYYNADFPETQIEVARLYGIQLFVV